MAGYKYDLLCKMYYVPQSTVCAKIMELLGQNKVDHRQRKVAIISQDSFYRVLTPEQKAKALKGQYNFDHPGRIVQTGLFKLPYLTTVHVSSFIYTVNQEWFGNYWDNQLGSFTF